jgi:hypothetical protein
VTDRPSATPDDDSPWGFFAARARRASDGSLAAKAAVGLIVALGALAWGGYGWSLIAAIALCFTGYGAWGILDRELNERGGAGAGGVARWLRLCRVLAVIVGVASAVAAVFTALALALGTWIS